MSDSNNYPVYLIIQLLPIRHNRFCQLFDNTCTFSVYSHAYRKDQNSTFYNLLHITAQRGYGTDDEEYAMGVGCIAVPIYDSENKPIAAIGTTGPVEFYHNAEEFQAILDFLKKTAQKISKEIS